MYKYCDAIIENALAIEEIPPTTTREKVRERKFRNMTPYPPPMVDNPDATDVEGNTIPGQPIKIPDPYATYDMNVIL